MFARIPKNNAHMTCVADVQQAIKLSIDFSSTFTEIIPIFSCVGDFEVSKKQFFTFYLRLQTEIPQFLGTIHSTTQPLHHHRCLFGMKLAALAAIFPDFTHFMEYSEKENSIGHSKEHF